MTRDWYDDLENVEQLLRWLRDGGAPEVHLTVDICIDIAAKPWHWTPEYDEMRKQERALEATAA
jgi:pyruvate-formate lyase-activating enzyme